MILRNEWLNHGQENATVKERETTTMYCEELLCKLSSEDEATTDDWGETQTCGQRPQQPRVDVAGALRLQTELTI